MTQKRPKAEVAQMRALIDGDPAHGKPGLTLQAVADLFGITKAAVRYHVGPVGRPAGRPARKPIVKQARKAPAQRKTKRK